MIYQIKDWDSHFENDRSRQRANCSFVCVPNKQHGMGFCRIMAEPDGAAIYGIWHCIVGACSQQRRRNGWLTSDGDKAGSAWGVADLALKFRRPEKEVERALQVLCSEKVGWIITHGNSQLTADSPPAHLEEKRREGKEEKGREGSPAHFSEIPNWKEIKEYAAGHGITENSARGFFDHHQGNNLWVNGYGRLIDWQHKLTVWQVKDREKASMSEHSTIIPSRPQGSNRGGPL